MTPSGTARPTAVYEEIAADVFATRDWILLFDDIRRTVHFRLPGGAADPVPPVRDGVKSLKHPINISGQSAGRADEANGQ